MERKTCLWMTSTTHPNYETECGSMYFRYVRDFSPPIKDGLCPFCNLPIEYDENEEEDD